MPFREWTAILPRSPLSQVTCVHLHGCRLACHSSFGLSARFLRIFSRVSREVEYLLKPSLLFVYVDSLHPARSRLVHLRSLLPRRCARRFRCLRRHMLARLFLASAVSLPPSLRLFVRHSASRLGARVMASATDATRDGGSQFPEGPSLEKLSLKCSFGKHRIRRRSRE